MPQPTQDELRKLWELCQDFVQKHEVLGAETVYQCDRVIEHAYEFIEQICDVVGYAELEED